MTDKEIKRRDALTIFMESVHKPDTRLRSCAHNQECFNELMEWREEVLQYLDQRRKEEFQYAYSFIASITLFRYSSAPRHSCSVSSLLSQREYNSSLNSNALD